MRIQATIQPGKPPSGDDHSEGVVQPASGRSGRLWLVSFACLTVAFAAAGSQGNSQTGWPVFRHDAQRSGRTAVLGPQTAPLAAKWVVQLTRGVSSSPSIAPDGTVYIGGYDKRLYAFSPADGHLVWEEPYLTGSFIFSSPAVGPDGSIIIGSDDHFIHAVTPSGRLKWRYETSSNVVSSAAFGADGTVYIGSMDGNLYALSGDFGLPRWVYTGLIATGSSPVIGPDGTIYIGGQDGSLHAILPSGERKWPVPFATGAEIRGAPALGADGTVYFGNLDGTFYAVLPSGTERWRFTLGTTGAIRGSPALGADGAIYFVAQDGYLRCLNTDGTLRWQVPVADQDIGEFDFFYSSPAIARDGTIYVGSPDQNLYAVRPDGTVAWRYDLGAAIHSSPALGPKGELYIGTLGGKVYAFEGPSPGIVYGDADGNGAANISDVVVLLNYVVKLRELTPEQLQAADVAPGRNPETGVVGNGVVDLSDVIRLIRRIIGLDGDPWP